MMSLRKNYFMYFCVFIGGMIVIFFIMTLYLKSKSYYKYRTLSNVQQVFNLTKDYKSQVINFVEKNGVCPSYKDEINKYYTASVEIRGDSKSCIIIARIKKTGELTSSISGRLVILELNITNKKSIKTSCYTNVDKQVFNIKSRAPVYDKPIHVLDCETEIPLYINKLID